jgi:phage-related protein
MSGLLAVVNSSDSDFDALTEAIENSNGACQEMYETANNNLEGQITILKSSVESLAISFGELLLPYVSKGVKVVQDIVTKFNSLTDAQKENIVKIAAMAAAVGPALLVFGKMVGKIGKVVSVVGKVGKAFKVFGSIAGLITSPAGIVIAVLGALVVAGVLVYKNWDKIKAAAGKLWSYVKKVFSGIGGSGEEMKEKISAIGDKFQTIGGKLQELWIVVQPVMTKIGELVKLVFEAHLGAAVGAAIGYFKSVFASATEIIGGVMTVFEGLIDFITGVFTGNWSKAWDGVKEIFGGAFEALTALAKAPLNAVIGLINGAIAGINNLGLTIPDWVPVLGGKTFSIDIPTIPTLAAGTDAWKGGIVQISERGGEIVDLPSGSRVYPHDESVAKAYTDGSRSASSTFRIEKLADQIVVREDADIDKIAQKLVDKIEKTSLNMGGGDIGYQY